MEIRVSVEPNEPLHTDGWGGRATDKGDHHQRTSADGQSGTTESQSILSDSCPCHGHEQITTLTTGA